MTLMTPSSRLSAGNRSSTPWRIFVLCLALAGCALSPQTVSLLPIVDVAMPDIGRDRPLALIVSDRRASPVLGSRGGLYGDTALITPRNPVDQTVRRALAERLTAAGFRVQPAGATAPLTLDVQIQQLGYRLDSQPGGLLNDARAEALLTATLSTGGQVRRSAQYRANSVRRVAGYPSEADNEALLNEVLGQSLRQLLQDPQLLSLLAG